MFRSSPAGTVHTSPTPRDRPSRAAKEQAEPDCAVSIATKAQPVTSGPDLDAVRERMVAAARHVSSAVRAPIGMVGRSRRELERIVTARINEVRRRRIDAPPRVLGARVMIVRKTLGDYRETAGGGGVQRPRRAGPSSCWRGSPGGDRPSAWLVVTFHAGDLRSYTDIRVHRPRDHRLTAVRGIRSW